jgi:hypothetical protein
MAGIDGDNSTEWRWMIDEREFVAALVRGSEAMADKVLRDALDDDVIRWCSQEVRTEFNELELAIATELVGARRVFWRRPSDTTIDVDYSNHCAIRIGPPWFFRRGPPKSMKMPGAEGLDIEVENFLYDEGPVFLLHKPKIKLTAYFIKLQHGDVVRRCRYLGLLSPASLASPFSPAPLQAAPKLPPTVESPVSESSPPLKQSTPLPESASEKAERKSASQRPASEKSPSEKVEQWLISMQAKFSRLPKKRRSRWVQDEAFPQLKIAFGEAAPWDSWQSLRRAMYPGRRKKLS